MRDKTSCACCLPFCQVAREFGFNFVLSSSASLVAESFRNTLDDNLRNNQIKNTNEHLWSSSASAAYILVWKYEICTVSSINIDAMFSCFAGFLENQSRKLITWLWRLSEDEPCTRIFFFPKISSRNRLSSLSFMQQSQAEREEERQRESEASGKKVKV